MISSRVVFDTDVIVAAVLSSTGASRRVLLSALDKEGITGLISVPLIVEYEAVLKRREHLVSAGIKADEIDIILDQLAASFQHVPVYYLWRPFLHDVNDDMVLETAVNGGAKFILSFNLSDFAGAHARFGVEVLRPGEFLKRGII